MALDDETIKRIEEQHPFIEFDWPRILKGQDAPPTEPRVPVEVRRPRERERERGSPRQQGQQDRPERQERSERRDTPAPVEATAGELADFAAALQRESAPAPTPEAAAPEVPPPDVIVAAHAKLGADGVARLRTRYAEIRARIPERVSDPAKREELQGQAARLSPDLWVTDEDVVRALDEYEAVLASLREVVGRKRRRRRRGARTAGSSDGRETGRSDDRELGSSEEQESEIDGAEEWTSSAETASERPTSRTSELPNSRPSGPPRPRSSEPPTPANPDPVSSESREEPEDNGL